MKDQDSFNTAMEEEQESADVQDPQDEQHQQPVEELGAEEEVSLPPTPTVVVKKNDEVVFEYTIEDLPVHIGRKSDNHIVLEEKNVSRKHAQILMKEDQYFIQDLESTGGTFVNGEPILEKDIHTGDLIKIGTYQLLFNSGIPEDERTIYDAEDATVLEEGTEMDEDRTLFYEEPEAKLVVIKSETLEGEITLEEEETVFGRDGEADVAIEDKRISRQHCKIWLDGTEYKITDLGSSNGTFVNGQKVTEKILENGDSIQIGSNTLEFRIEKPVKPGEKRLSLPLVKAAVGILAIAAMAYTTYRIIPAFRSRGPQKVILQKLWERSSLASVVASPSLGDLNGDGYTNLAAADLSGIVFALDGRQGGLIWNSELKTSGGPLLGSPLLADINKKDGEVDVVVATSTRGVLAIDGSTMRLIWRGNVDAAIPGTPKAADINNDGTNDVFVGTKSGSVICLDGRQGGAVWESQLGAPINTSPVLADLNKDGKADVIIGADNHKIHAFDGTNGHTIWIHVGTDLPSTATAADMNEDGIPDLAVITPVELVVLEGQKGAALWRWSLPQTARPTADDPFRPVPPAVSDLNGDRILDVIVSTAGGHVYAIDGASQGSAYIWDYGLTPTPKTAPALCDLNNDGNADVVVGDRDGNLIVIDGTTGHQLNILNVGSSVVSSPVIGDFNANGSVDIAVGTEDKKIIAIETETSVKKNQIVWNSL